MRVRIPIRLAVRFKLLEREVWVPDERQIITDRQWSRIELHCVGKKSDPERTGGDGRLCSGVRHERPPVTVNAGRGVARNGATLPLGSARGTRLSRGSASGVLQEYLCVFSLAKACGAVSWPMVQAMPWAPTLGFTIVGGHYPALFAHGRVVRPDGCTTPGVHTPGAP